MTPVKTAISLEEPLLKQVDGLAVESFIEQQQTQALLEVLNAAYDDKPILDEEEYFQRMRQHHRKQLKEEE